MLLRMLMFLTLSTLSIGTGASESAIELKPGGKQLFLDDHVVQSVDGLTRTMHSPEKRGAVLKPDIPSDGCAVAALSAPMWVPEEGVYKVVYNAYTMDDHRGIGPSLAISKDGIHWEKPIIGEVDVCGSKENNRVVLDADLHWTDNALFSVIYDADDPDPARRYKGLLGSSGRAPVVSPDCIHWTRLPVPRIPSSDVSQLVRDPEHGRYLAMLKGGNEFGRAFNIAMSEDFEHWTQPRFLFGADAEDQTRAVENIRRRLLDPGLAKPQFVDPDPAIGWRPPEGKKMHPTWRAECYNMPVFPYEGLYIGLPQMYHPCGQSLPSRANTDGFHLIQLAMTRDLKHWKRLGNRMPFIGPSRLEDGLLGTFDRLQLGANNQPVVRGDELWFYYTGMKWRTYLYELWTDGSPRDAATLSDEERADLDDGWGALCLAVLRLDGFVSLDAGENGGHVLTKPVQAVGRGLFLNLAAADGSARVEILDEQGTDIPGFSADDAVPMTGDGVRLPVAWKGGSDLSRFAGKVIRLRIHLKKAALFAFWME